MAAGTELTPTSYIQHHLTHLTRPVGDQGGFWTIHVDTIVTTLIIGVLCFGFLWLVTRKATAGVPSKTQAFVELCIGFIDDQVKSIYHGTSPLVAPLALTTFVLVLFMLFPMFHYCHLLNDIFWFGLYYEGARGA